MACQEKQAPGSNHNEATESNQGCVVMQIVRSWTATCLDCKCSPQNARHTVLNWATKRVCLHTSLATTAPDVAQCRELQQE